MMVEDRSDDRSLRNRSVLVDVTNQNGKRGFPPFSIDSVGKDGSGGYRETMQNEDEGLRFANEILRRAKRLCSSRNLDYVGETPQENEMDSISKVSNEIKELSSSVSLMEERPHFERDEVVVPGNVEEEDNVVKKSCISGVSMVLGHGDCSNDDSSSSSAIFGESCKDDKEKLNHDVSENVVGINPVSEPVSIHVIEIDGDDLTSNKSSLVGCIGFSGSSSLKVSEPEKCIGFNGDDGEQCKDEEVAVDPDVSRNVVGTNPSSEALNAYVIVNDDEGMDGDDLTSNKSGSVGCVGISGSSSSRGFESERCTGFTGDGGSDSSAGTDLLKSCSCSFCLKAAHIWSDLHYQDTKGRLSVLKKSRKEVRTLVERSSMLGAFAKNFQEDPNKSVKLETDLVGGWRSLFLHTEDIFLRESAQLQSSLITLKELRGNCKANLEMITGDPLNKK